MVGGKLKLRGESYKGEKNGGKQRALVNMNIEDARNLNDRVMTQF